MTPRQLIVTTILACFCALPIVAQKQAKMASIFVQTPEELIPALNQDLKSDLVEQYYDRTDTELRNLYNGPCRITKITDSYLRLELDSTMVVEFKQLGGRWFRPKYYGMSVTSTISPALSVLSFFDTKWAPIPRSSMVALPEPEQFLITPADSIRLDYKKARIEREVWEYVATFDPDRPTLTFRISAFDEPLAKKQHPTVPQLLKEITYRWRHNRFVH